VPHNFFIALPAGIIGTKGVLEPGKDGYLVITAPAQPGDYFFWCDVGSHRFQGMNGTLTVAAAGGGAPGMPRTGGSGLAWDSLLISLVAVLLLTAGVALLGRRQATR
jgi:hypothetical protein